MNPFSPSPSSSTGAAAAAAGTHHLASDQDFAHLRSTSTGFELVRDPTLSHSSSSDTHSSSPAGTRSSGSASPAFGHTSSSAQTQSTATTPLTRSYTGSSADTVTPGDARQEHFEMARTDQEQEMQEPVSPWLSSSVGTIAAVGLPPGAGLTQPPGLVTQKSSSSVIRPGGNAVELTIERTTTIPNAQGPRSLSTVSNIGSLEDPSPSPVSPTAATTNPQAAMTSSSLFPPGPAPPLPPRPSASKLSPLLHHGLPPPSLPGDKLRRRDDTFPTLRGDDVDPHSPEQLLEDNCYLLWQLRRVHRTVKQAGRLAEELAGLCEEERRVDRKLADVSRVHALILRRVLGQGERRGYHDDRGGSAGEHGGYRQHGGHHQHRYHEAGRSTLSGGLTLPVRGPIGSPSARVLY